jgi:hypothetical protein
MADTTNQSQTANTNNGHVTVTNIADIMANAVPMNAIHTEALNFRQLPQDVRDHLTHNLIIPGAPLEFYRGAYKGALELVQCIVRTTGIESDAGVQGVLHLFCYAAEIERLMNEITPAENPLGNRSTRRAHARQANTKPKTRGGDKK